jgi:hypothetical protein
MSVHITDMPYQNTAVKFFFCIMCWSKEGPKILFPEKKMRVRAPPIKVISYMQEGTRRGYTQASKMLVHTTIVPSRSAGTTPMLSPMPSPLTKPTQMVHPSKMVDPSKAVDPSELTAELNALREKMELTMRQHAKKGQTKTSLASIEENAAELKRREVQRKGDEDAETAATLEKMRDFYSRFNPAKVGKVNNSKKANVNRI